MNINIISQYKGLRRENYILCFGRLVTAMGAMVRPMLTMILSQKLGMNAVQVAWVTALMGILSIPANLIGGKMADRFSKKMNIVYLDIVSVVCYIICGLIPLSGKSIVLMFIASTCQNMENPSYNSLTADITLTEDRERGYSLQYLMGNLGGVMASAVAGFMFRNYLWLAFLLSGISIGISSVLIFLFVQNITPVKDISQKAVYQADRHGESLWTILRENRLILLYILTASGYGAMYQMYNYLVPMDLVRLHGDTGAVIYGTVTSVNCIIVVIFTPIFTKLLHRFSEPVKTMYGYLYDLVCWKIFCFCSRDGISTWQVRTISEGDKAFCMNLFLKIINNLRDSFFPVSQMLQRIFQEQSEGCGLFWIYELLNVAKVYFLSSKQESSFSMNFYFETIRFACAMSM